MASSSFALALQAFEARPTRAEALADLSAYCRERGWNESAAMFAQRGLKIKPTDDMLFVETTAHEQLTSDLSIVAFYSADPEIRKLGYETCDRLALDRSVSHEVRSLARHNLEFYLKKIGQDVPRGTFSDCVFPSWRARRLTFSPPDGYNQMAPSVTKHGDRILAAQRTINYAIDHRGYYRIADNVPLVGGCLIHTRTFLIEIDPDTLQESVLGEITMPSLAPMPGAIVQGFEDARLFSWRGDLWTLSTVLDQNTEGRAEQWLARLAPNLEMVNAYPIYPEGSIQPREKNWMPVVDGDDLRFIYYSDPGRVIDPEGRTVAEHIPALAADHLRGTSQAIPFEDGWLAILHWVEWFSGHDGTWPKYRHRFGWYDRDLKLQRVSPGWVWPSTAVPELLRGYQYATGLTKHPDGQRLIIGYQLDERESWIGTIETKEVATVLELSSPHPCVTLHSSATQGITQPSSTTQGTAWLDPAPQKAATITEPNNAVNLGHREREAWVGTLDALDVSRALEIEDPPRSLSPPRAIPQPPEKSGGSFLRFDDDAWVRSQTNRALQTVAQVDRATRMLQQGDLPEHPDRIKNWDNYLALHHAVATTAPSGPVLDAGGDHRSAFLPGLARLGFKRLLNLNLDEPVPGFSGGIEYLRGNITSTGFDSGHFDFISCLSVLEHGVNWRGFLDEAARLLAPGGHLFLSVDYWEIPVSTAHVVFQGSYAGQRWEIFAPAEIYELASYAQAIGLSLVGDMDFRCRDRVASHLACDFTFCNLLFRR